MSKNGKSNKNKRSKSNKMKSRSNGNEYLQKSNGNTNGDLRSLSNAELQAEILAAETEHPKIQKLIELAESKGKISIDEIVTLYPEAEEDIGILDETLASLLEAGVEIVEKASDDDEGDFANAEDKDGFMPEKERFNVEIKKIKRRSRGKSGISALDVDDTIGLYLKEVGRVPLLTKDEEVWLAKRMEKAVQAEEELNSDKNISRDRKSILNQDIEDGAEAREHLVTANSRLVISVAKKYIGRGVPFLDLIQEGNIGLLRAAKKFDYHRGHKFSTYATWWIRQAVTRAIADQGRTIRVPVHMGDQINKLLRVSHSLTQKLGRDPTVEELANLLDVTPKKVEDMVQIARRPLSLEAPTDDQEDSSVGDFVKDEDSPAPVEATTQNMLRLQIRDALTGLPPREVRILQLRYGLLDGESYTLEEVGRKMGVTRERVRQIEAQALGRLRTPDQKELLEGFLREY